MLIGSSALLSKVVKRGIGGGTPSVVVDFRLNEPVETTVSPLISTKSVIIDAMGEPETHKPLKSNHLRISYVVE